MHAADPYRVLYTLNTRLFGNCFDGVDDEAAGRRFDGRTNNLAFLGCHLVDVRVFLLGLLGEEVERPFGGRLDTARSLDEIDEMPALEEILDAWSDVSERLEAALDALPFDGLVTPVEPEFPGGDGTLAGALAFLAQHESYHVGQMALLRRWLGLPAMSYD